MSMALSMRGQMPSATSRVPSGFLKIMPSENVSFWTHAAGAVLAFIGSMFLLSYTKAGVVATLVSMAYTFAICWMFSASAIYHAKKRAEGETSVWRKFDHCAIFFMIAGAYTPLSYYWLSGSMRFGIILAQWIVVALGVVFKLFWLRAPRWLYTSIYLLMGWMAVIPIADLWHNMGPLLFSFVIGGGVVYSIGALFYVTKKPTIVPGYFGFHEIFHVLVAAALQYAAIFLTVKGFAGA